MANKIYTNGKIKRAILAAIAMVTLFTSVAAPASKVFADEQPEIIEVQGMNEDITKGLIHASVGKIPVIGSFAQVFTDAIFGEIFGGKSDMDELKARFDHMELLIKGEAQTILKTLYDNKFDDFNKDITNLRGMTAGYLDDIDTYINNPDFNDVDKAIAIGCLFENRSSNLNDYLNIIETSCQYVAGTPVVLKDHESIYVKAYKSCCDKEKEKSALGGEAAAKAAGYVNEVNTILESAQKVEAMVLNAKMELAQRISEMDEDQLKALKAEYSDRSKQLALISEAADPKHAALDTWQRTAKKIKDENYLLFDIDNPNSVVSRYNKMVDGYRFCYILSSDYSTRPATITYIPLSSEMVLTDAWEQGLEETIRYHVKDGALCGKRIVTDNLSKFYKSSGLTTEQINDIAQAMDSSAKLFHPKHRDCSLLESMHYYGFNIDELVREYTSKKYKGSLKEELSDYEMRYMSRPQILSCVRVKDSGKCYTEGYDIYQCAFANNLVFFCWSPEEARDYPLGCFLRFQKGEMPADPWQGFVSTADEIDALSNDLSVEMVDALTINGAEFEDTETEDVNEVNDGSIVITVEDGMISGENEGYAWEVAGDGTILLNEGEFRFKGTLEGRNIQVMRNATILSGTFENCEIAYEEGAVIAAEVELINTNLVNMYEEVEEYNEEEIENEEFEDITENEEEISEESEETEDIEVIEENEEVPEIIEEDPVIIEETPVEIVY